MTSQKRRHGKEGKRDVHYNPKLFLTFYVPLAIYLSTFAALY
jgi:hypothetical protein